jgi:hypothetical protein
MFTIDPRACSHRYGTLRRTVDDAHEVHREGHVPSAVSYVHDALFTRQSM